MRVFENEYIKMCEKNHLILMYLKVERIDISVAKEVVNQRINFTIHNDALIFVDGTKVKEIDRESRDYFASEESNEKLKAIALYANSNFSVFLANFILKVNKAKFQEPRRLFFNKKEALLWLNSFKCN